MGHLYASIEPSRDCHVPISEMTFAIFILHYVPAVWSLISFLFANSTILKRFQKYLQLCLNSLAEEYPRHNELYDMKSDQWTQEDPVLTSLPIFH